MSSAATHLELTARFVLAREAGRADHYQQPAPAGRPVSSVHPLTIYIVVVSLWVVQSRHQADLFNVTRAQEDEPPTERRPKNRSDFLISIPNMNDLLWQFQIFDTNATIHRVKAASSLSWGLKLYRLFGSPQNTSQCILTTEELMILESTTKSVSAAFGFFLEEGPTPQLEATYLEGQIWEEKILKKLLKLWFDPIQSEKK